MASLIQSSCTLLSTNSRCRFPQPRRRFEVSCTGGEKPIDRRNMLLGMGGLYTAANLNLNQALSAPIPPPDFSTCHESIIENPAGDTITANRCPPYSPTYEDYILPPVKRMRVRRPAHRLGPNDPQLIKYKKAIQIMRDLDITDPDNPLGFTQQAKIHCAYCNAAYPEDEYPGIDISAHFSWLFFPFHRWYLYFYERILGSLIGDPTFALPYWNWDNPDGGMMIPAIFNDPASPLFDTKRNQEHLPPAVVDLTLGIPGGGVRSYPDQTNVDPKIQVGRNLAEMYNEMIGGPARVTDFMGQPYRAGQPMPLGPCGGTSERGSHTSMHMWVGDPREEFNQDLGNFYSAGNDPLFYSHHSNVDRMWTIWETLKTRVPKHIYDPDFLNSSFLFYDETKKLVRVRVRDCLDPAKLGYTYEPSPTPWMSYRPRKKLVRANLQNISSQAGTADKVFPLTLNQTIRVLVPKTTKGKADEVLVIQSIFVELTSSVKFNVFINDEDDDALNIDRPEYAGTFGQLAMNHAHSMNRATSAGRDLNLSLTELYENIDIDDGDSAVVVTIYPIYNGQEVTIGGISIVEAPRD